jgi:GNAT superfamily N-acetyltransferase
MPPTTFSRFAPEHEPSWLRCRTLSFLGSAYFDDVRTRRPAEPQLQLVAVRDDAVIGILDVEVEGSLATIDTLATHPDHQQEGIASRLLDLALEQLPPHVVTLDAWTRDDEPALAWYRRHAFVESEHYLHVYKSWSEHVPGFSSPEGLSVPVTAFCHGVLADEAEMRERFARVHVCRRFSRELTVDAGPEG